MTATALIAFGSGKVIAAKSRSFLEAHIAKEYCEECNAAAVVQGRAVTFVQNNREVKSTYTEGATATDKLWVHGLLTTCTAGKSTHSSTAGMCRMWYLTTLVFTYKCKCAVFACFYVV